MNFRRLWKGLLIDESKFEQRVFVRWTPEWMSENCTVPTVKHGGGALVIWGSFGGEIAGDFVQIKGIMWKEKYHSILQRKTIPSGCCIIGQSFVLYQDNDPRHCSKLCTNYLKSKEDEGILQIWWFGPLSLLISPTELVWVEIDCKVQSECLRISKSCLHIYTLLGNHFFQHAVQVTRKDAKNLLSCIKCL